MKKLSLGLLLGLLMLGAAFFTLPVQAGFTVATPSVSGPLVVKPLQRYVFTATGFASTDVVEIYLGSGLVGKGKTTAGTLVVTGTIPGNLPYGGWLITARNLTGKSITYSTTITPVLITTASQGFKGGSLRLEGNGWASSEIVTLNFRTAAGCLTGTNYLTTTVRATAQGVIVTNTVVPQVVDGVYYVMGLGATSNICTIAP